MGKGGEGEEEDNRVAGELMEEGRGTVVVGERKERKMEGEREETIR